MDQKLHCSLVDQRKGQLKGKYISLLPPFLITSTSAKSSALSDSRRKTNVWASFGVALQSLDVILAEPVGSRTDISALDC
jgi:hypothetical protein